MDETEVDDSSPIKVNDYVVQGLAEERNIEVLSFKWSMSSSKLQINSNQGQGDQYCEFPHYSIPYPLGKSINKSSSWKIGTNPCYMENGLQYISMYLCMCSLDPPAEHVDVTYTFQVIETAWAKIAHEQRSGIRRFTKESPSFGWAKFISCIHLGSNPPDEIWFRAKIGLYSDPVPVLLPPTPLRMFGFSKREDFLKTPTPLAFYDPDIAKGNNSSTSVQFMEMSADDGEQFQKDEETKKHVASLWLSKSKCDGQVVVKGCVIPVHISVLKVKSSVFDKHFSELDCKGNSLKHFVINNFEKEVVEAALEFCYTKTITKVFSNSNVNFELLEAAKKLSINGLKDFAIEMILASINVKNFESIYNMMVEDRLADGEEFSIGQFLKLLLEKRRQNRRLLSDYEENASKYASLIFE